MMRVICTAARLTLVSDEARDAPGLRGSRACYGALLAAPAQFGRERYDGESLGLRGSGALALREGGVGHA